MSTLYNVGYEKNVIAGIIQYPDVFMELSLIESSDFSRINGPIWAIIKNTIENKGEPTPIVLAERLKAIGIKFEGIEPFDYLDSLRILPVDKRAIVGIAKELKKLSLIRNIHTQAGLLQKQVVEMKGAPAKDIFKALNDTIGNSITMLDSTESEAVDLYAGLEAFIEEKGNNPVEEVGYKMPFKLWNEYYGGLRKGGVYITASRSGQGKSTFLSYIGDEVSNVCNPGMNIKTLFLDTEMSAEDQMIRLAAARIGCPFYLIDTGQWRKSEEWCPKVRAGLQKLRTENRSMWFKQAARMTTDDLINFIKKWFYKNVGKDGHGFVVYDYLKVLTSDGNGKTPEWQLVLDKMQKFKDLADEIKVPIFTALQVNRAGTTTNKAAGEVVDDESVLSISGRIDWLANFVAILRRNTPDETAAGIPDATHRLVPLKTRFQGRTSAGHQDLVKIMEGKKTKYKQNYLEFKLDNFKVEEMGDFRGWAEATGMTRVKKDDSSEKGLL
jgi:replicative DNA helicase